MNANATPGKQLALLTRQLRRSGTMKIPRDSCLLVVTRIQPAILRHISTTTRHDSRHIPNTTTFHTTIEHSSLLFDKNKYP